MKIEKTRLFFENFEKMFGYTDNPAISEKTNHTLQYLINIRSLSDN